MDPSLDLRQINPGTLSYNTRGRYSLSTRPDDTPVTEAMLQADVFSVPVDSLIDIWTLRFGSTWVNLEDIETDEFFKMAYVRLKSLGKLEVHYLTDRSRYVCRKPE